jgi:hypothetical protein
VAEPNNPASASNWPEEGLNEFTQLQAINPTRDGEVRLPLQDRLFESVTPPPSRAGSRGREFAPAIRRDLTALLFGQPEGHAEGVSKVRIRVSESSASST